jgi:tagatose 6-phosphate kinase
MILCITLNPVVDMTLFVDEIKPVYRTDAHRVTYIAGGKGNNVARALLRLGHSARVFLPLGGASGRHEAELLEAEGIEKTVAWVSGDTRVAITIVDRDYQQRAFFTPSAPVTPEDLSLIRKRFEEALAGAKAMCLCGSSPAPQADCLFPEFLHRATQQGIPTLLDTYGDALRLGLEAAPTIVKINRAEASVLLGRPLGTLEAQISALNELRCSGTRWAVLTLGDQGALFTCEEGSWLAQPPPRKVVNPIGSGDAMTAGLLAGWITGQSPEDCFRLGMASAVANTLTWEAGHIDPDEVEALLPQIQLTPLSARGN